MLITGKLQKETQNVGKENQTRRGLAERRVSWVTRVALREEQYEL